MRGHGRRGGFLACGLMGLMMTLIGEPAPARAAETELRDFAILIDGKRGGEYHMSIIKQDDGTTLMGGVASVRVSYLIKTYTYSYRGMELWKDGRLQRLDSSTNDDGKEFTVSAVADGQRLRVTVNGQVHAARGDVWTMTYWKLADARFRNQAVPLIDADTGKSMNGVLRHVGAGQVQMNGASVACQHYRVTGDVTADLWYDGHERLVRQETTEDGHRMILELTGVRHP